MQKLKPTIEKHGDQKNYTKLQKKSMVYDADRQSK